MKFLLDESLNSATIRDHMDQCSSRAADLQHKLRSLTTELKLLKVKEDMLGLSMEKANSGVFNGRGDLKSDASSSLPIIENSSRGKPSERSSHLSPFLSFTPLEGRPSLNEQPNQPPSGSNKGASPAVTFSQSLLSAIQVLPGHNVSSSTSDRVTEHVPPAPASSNYESRSHQFHDQSDVLPSQDSTLKVGALKNEISNLRDSIASIELELLKISLRKDFLGRDSNGRAYWGFHCHGARPWIMACGDLAFKERCPEEFVGIPDSEKWMYYESDDEIEKLVGWLRENNVREKELKESILQLQNNKLKDSQYTENHILSEAEPDHNGRKSLSANISATKALVALEKRFGPCLGNDATDSRQNLASGVSPDCRMYRCQCLELLWPSKDHCAFCHQSFPTAEALRQHSKENCKGVASISKKSQPTEDTSKRKKARNVASQEKRPGNIGSLQTSTSEKQNDGSFFDEGYQSRCPFNFAEIMTRFVVPGSVKDDVNEIGLIGSGGIPSLISSGSSSLSDPALALGSTRTNEASSSEMPTDLRSNQQHSSTEAGAVVNIKDNKDSNKLSKSAENKSVSTSGRDRVSSAKDKNSLFELSRSNLIRETSSRPLVGRASEILRFLKINLLDMDDALPQDALRTSKSNQDRRCAWRAFVKSAKSIYEVSHDFLFINVLQMFSALLVLIYHCMCNVLLRKFTHE